MPSGGRQENPHICDLLFKKIERPSFFCESTNLVCFFQLFCASVSTLFFGYCKVFFSSEFVDVDADQQRELLAFFAGNTEKSF